eukprot:scaffold16244_cov80-Skeletonema_menzelii.AAC.1
MSLLLDQDNSHHLSMLAVRLRSVVDGGSILQVDYSIEIIETHLNGIDCKLSLSRERGVQYDKGKAKSKEQRYIYLREREQKRKERDDERRKGEAGKRRKYMG